VTARLATLFALVTLVAAAGRPVAGRQPQGGGDPWADASEGAWVILERSGSFDGKAVDPRREKRVRTRFTGRTAVAHYEEKGGKFPDRPNSHSMHIPGYDPAEEKRFTKVAAKTDRLTIDGRAVECEAATYRFEKPENRYAVTVTVWRRKGLGLPYRELLTEGPEVAMGPDVVAAEAETRTKDGTEFVSARVVALKDERTVGGKKVTCVREELKVRIAKEKEESGTLKGSRWLSADVPGHLLLEELAGEADGKPVTQRQAVVELFVPAAKK
jgi:hypothetical protein